MKNATPQGVALFVVILQRSDQSRGEGEAVCKKRRGALTHPEDLYKPAFFPVIRLWN